MLQYEGVFLSSLVFIQKFNELCIQAINTTPFGK